MLPGIDGTLITGDFAERILPVRFAGRLGEADRGRALARLRRWWRSVDGSCGPASGVRLLAEGAARPLVETLGFQITRTDPIAPDLWALVLTRASAFIPLLVLPWEAPFAPAWRQAVRQGLLYRAPWALMFNGRRLRVVDAARTHARRHLDFELPIALEHDAAADVLWGLARAEAFVPLPDEGCDLVGALTRASDEEGARVCSALRGGVLAAIEHVLGALAAQERGRRTPLLELHDEALTAVYRILFLLFAEARQLVPVWHPLYREAYSVETLRHAADAERRTTGLWDALQAIGRLAHAGCSAGDLTVTAFNGRLFSPARAPRLARAHLPDAAIAEALLAVSTVRSAQGRQRIAFRDLGVEELGSVYEGLLEYEPGAAPGPPTAGDPGAERPAGPAVRLRKTGAARRKATGTFYTPRTITHFVVQQTLAPLVAGRTSGQLLTLRICDPAMGSGAFLVAACHHLARAYETALIEEGACAAGDLDDRDRAAFRRLIARRCLFGVDVNPMAVQLARLSLWLTTLAADQPLTFLDHRLTTGNSLIGARPMDLLRTTASRGRTPSGTAQLPLFELTELSGMLAPVLPIRLRLALTPDDSAETVHDKEAALAALARRSDTARWRLACDIWCANWCEPRPSPPATLRTLLDDALHGESPLSRRLAERERTRAQHAAARHGFFHWPLEFPEVFFDETGLERPDAGFDAIVGNPPWEMLRADAPDTAGTHALTRAAVQYVRRSGLYTARASGHANQYQLFVERALDLTRSGGRLGLVVPAGLCVEAGSAALRQRLLRQSRLDVIVGFDNRSGWFPIHRSTRFLLMTATRGGETRETRCCFGLQDSAALDDLAERVAAGDPRAFPLVVTPSAVERIFGPDLPIPPLTSMEDLRIADRLASGLPRLGDAAGWHARFGRELNATDHRPHFTADARGLRVLEGKHVLPFSVRAAGASTFLDPVVAAALLGGRQPFWRSRLAFRDVASATNRQTLIAAIVPGGCITTHTLFCLRDRLRLADQRVLCALLNSYPVNFLVRQRVTTHVTLAVMRTIPVPRPDAASPLYAALDEGARALERAGGAAADPGLAARVQAAAAAACGLSRADYEYVLTTFPLVPEAERQRALDAFTRGSRSGY